MRWPFRRHVLPTDAPAIAEEVPQAPAREARPEAWRELAPLRTLEPVELTADGRRFSEGLGVRHPAELALKPLGHDLTLEAPQGLVSGLAHVVEAPDRGLELPLVPPPRHEAPPAPVARPRRPVQTAQAAPPPPVPAPHAARANGLRGSACQSARARAGSRSRRRRRSSSRPPSSRLRRASSRPCRFPRRNPPSCAPRSCRSSRARFRSHGPLRPPLLRRPRAPRASPSSARLRSSSRRRQRPRRRARCASSRCPHRPPRRMSPSLPRPDEPLPTVGSRLEPTIDAPTPVAPPVVPSSAPTPVDLPDAPLPVLRRPGLGPPISKLPEADIARPPVAHPEPTPAPRAAPPRAAQREVDPPVRPVQRALPAEPTRGPGRPARRSSSLRWCRRRRADASDRSGARADSLAQRAGAGAARRGHGDPPERRAGTDGERPGRPGRRGRAQPGAAGPADRALAVRGRDAARPAPRAVPAAAASPSPRPVGAPRAARGRRDARPAGRPDRGSAAAARRHA